MTFSDPWPPWAAPYESIGPARQPPAMTVAAAYWADRTAGGLVFAERGHLAMEWQHAESGRLDRLASQLIAARDRAEEARRRAEEAGGGQRLRRKGALAELLAPWVRGAMDQGAIDDGEEGGVEPVTKGRWWGRRAAGKVDPVAEGRMRRNDAERYFIYHPEGRAEVTARMVAHNVRVDAAAPLVREATRAAAQVRVLESRVADLAERARAAALSVRLVGDPARAAGWARLAVKAEELLLPGEGTPIAQQTGVAALAAIVTDGDRLVEYSEGQSVVRACVSEQVARNEMARPRSAEGLASNTSRRQTGLGHGSAGA